MTSDPDSSGSLNTLSDLMLYLPTPELRAELEAYRVGWEHEHGPIDLTRHYTCTWPRVTQLWLYNNAPRRYFEGLPDFVKEFCRAKVRENAANGNLDDLPEQILRLVRAASQPDTGRSL